MADPFEGWTDAPVAPAEATKGWVDAPADAPAPDVDEQLAATFTSAFKKSPDRNAGVLKLAKDLRIPSQVADVRFEEFSASWNAAQFDPKAWRQANPDLAKLALERPDLGELVVRDQKLSWLVRAVNAVTDFAEDVSESPVGRNVLTLATAGAFGPGAEAPPVGSPEEAALLKREAEKRTAAREVRDTPKKVALLDDAAAKEAREGPPALIPLYRYRETAAQMDVAKLQFELMTKRAAGVDTFALEKEILDRKRTLVTRDYGEGSTAQIFTDIAQAGASQVSVFKDAGALGLVGAGVGAAVGGYATKTPAGASAGALRGASMLGKVGAAAGSLRLEAGSAYGELLEARTDDGRPLTEDQARGGALLYGGFATMFELASTAQMLKALGPLGTALRAGTGKAAVAQLMKDAGFRQLAARVGKDWLKAGLAEGGEEFVQQAMQDAVTYLARSDAAGKWQAGPVIDVQNALAAGEKGLVGGLGLGAGASFVHTTTHGISQLVNRLKTDRAAASARQVAAIASVADSPTAKAAPDVVAKLITDATAKTGQPVTHLHVDPRALVEALSAEGELSEQLGKVLGPDGQQMVDQAIATDTPVAIPLATVIKNISGTPLAAKLVPHASTAADIPSARQAAAEPIPAQTEAEASQLLTQHFEALTPEHRRRSFFIDSTTGVLNDRAFKRIDAAGRQVAVISVEGVKFENDRAGHEAGDNVYRAAARALAPHAPEVAKVKGDFAVYVKDQAELDALLEKANAAADLQGFRLHGTAGADLRTASAANNAAKAALEKLDKRSARGVRPKGAVEGYSFPNTQVEGTGISPALAATYDAIGDDAKAFGEMFTDEDTGLLNKDGRDAARMLRPKRFRASLDLNGLAELNHVLGEEVGDAAIRVFGQLLLERGGHAFDAAHVSGDEFTIDSDDRAALEEFLAGLAEDGENATLEFEVDGKPLVMNGVSFGRGIGETHDAAEIALNAHKAELLAAGQRGPGAALRRISEGRRSLGGRPEGEGPQGRAEEHRNRRPEVVGLRQRFLGTREEVTLATEVARVQTRMGLTQVFRSPAEAGMNADQWADYLRTVEEATSHAALAAELRERKDELRTTEAWWKEQEREERANAETDYEQLPAVRALRMLRGDDPLVPVPIKLNRAVVEEAIGAEAAKKFRLLKDGVHPDEVADLVGFPSGTELLQAVAALAPKADWVKQVAAERMLERYPTIAADRLELRDVVAQGLHGDATAKWLMQEISALKSRVGAPGTLSPPESYRRTAEQWLERYTVEDLRPARSLQAERSTAEKALHAMAKGNYARALNFKKQQLLNFQLYRVTTELRDEMQAAEEFFAARTSDSFRAGLGKASPAYLGAHDAILGALGFGPRRAALDQQLADLAQAEQLAAADGNPFAFDVDAIRALLGAPKAWGELTTAEARNARNAVKNIRAIANAVNEVTLAGEKQAVEDIVGRIVEESAALPDLGKAPAAREQVGPARKAFDFALGLQGELLDPEQIFGMLGPAARSLFERYLAAKTEKYAIAKSALDPLVKLWESLPKETMARRWDVLTDLDTSLPIPEDINLGGPRDRLWLLMVALNVGNASNRERLVGGFQWSEAQVLGVLDKHLTKAEWEWVQSIWTVLDKELWPLVAAKEQRKTGLVPEKIRPTPIVTRHGTFAGGYFPARFDPRASVGDIGERQAEAGIASLYGPGYVRSSTLKSHTKKRAEHYANVINLDWSVVPSHVAQVLHDIAFDEMVRDSGRVLFHPKVQTALYRRLGEKRSTEPRDWLKFVANAQANSGAVRASQMAKLLGGLKSRLVAGAIGWASTVAMGDFANALVAITKGGVSPRFGTQGFLAAFPLSPTFPSMRKTALAKSPELRNRLSAFTEQKRADYLQKIGKRRAKLTRALEAVGNTSWFFLEQTDKMASTQVWLGRYWQSKAEGAVEGEAVRAADALVRETLPTPERSEMPALVRDSGTAGSILVFYGYFSKMFNVLASVGREPVLAITKAKRSGAPVDYAKAGLIAARSAGQVLATMFVFNVLGELLAGRGPDDDETPEQFLLRKMLSAGPNVLPFGTLAEPVISHAVTGKAALMSPRAAPALSLVEGVLRGVGTAVDSEAEDDKRAWAALETALIAAKLPARQPTKTLKYIDMVVSGEAEPEGPVDFASGVLYGKKRGR